MHQLMCYTIRETFDEDRTKADNNTYDREDVRPFTHTQEVNLSILQEVAGSLVVEGDTFVLSHSSFENQTGDEDRGKQ